ncbi:MAG: 50S ribosomal protein L1 [Candidatus Thermoplasmatota archaeon]|jgi:large subunit ribosomal protein L1|nr:50S ribosomal protein L1 [Candidatus Thermoplasmatota archaeon]MCL5983488.1 50S ribosomal protein L1 [Candidatus Thermoplasmatota archaeon]
MADRSALEVVNEALGKSPERKFTESVEVSVNLKDLDLTIPKNRLEDEIPLPNGRGRPVRVAVIASPEMAQKVRGVADEVIASTDLDEAVKNAKKLAGRIDFFLAEAPLMPTIGKRLGTVLGPRGKMPRPIAPGSDPSNLIRALQRSIRVRSKGNRTFHAPVGTRTMPPEQVAQNVDAVLNRIVGKLERGRTNIESVYVKTTMGPAVRLW